MAIYLKLGNVKGNVTASGYEGQIAVLSAHFGVARAVSMEPGNVSNRESSKPSLSEITITKLADNSVAALFKEALTGSKGEEALLTFVRTGSDKVQEFMTYKLSDCIISSYSISAQGDEEPVENISLSYSAIEVSYKDHDASNKTGNPQRAAYNLVTTKAA
ncbi:MAG: Hcp1 family type VI secretion system effector [Gammaproteobacteria bacterium]|nr:Hcp1 family type VI secretion system effector [Gammaproteobacteria bacterium]